MSRFRLIIASQCLITLGVITLYDQSSHAQIRTFTERALIKAYEPQKIQGVLFDSPSHCIIGELSHNMKFSKTAPDAYCVDEQYYPGAALRIGNLNLLGLDPKTLKTPLGLVMVSAQEYPNLWSQLKPQGACPERRIRPSQFRSDWYAQEGGYRNSRERLQRASYLKLLNPQITALQLLEIDKPNLPSQHPRYSFKGPIDPAVIKIRNQTNQPFHGVTLKLHYEGGGGKPMPHYESIPIKLSAGETLSLEVVMLMKRSNEGRAIWRLIDATLQGMIGSCQLL